MATKPATEPAPAKPPTITSSFKTTVIKPLEITWDDFGRTLRALRAPLHRVLNGVVRELELNRGEGECWAPTNKDISAGRTVCSAWTASYRFAGMLWEKERAEAEQRVTAKKGYTGDEAIAEIKPTSAVIRGVAGAAFARWNKFQKDRWKGTTSLPSFRNRSPIYVTSHGVSFRAEDGQAILSIRLTDRWFDVVLGVDGGSAHAMIRRLMRKELEPGDVKLVEITDRHSGKPKWLAIMSITQAAPADREGRVMALHRGIKSFLTCAISRSKDDTQDAFTAILETGDDVLRHKAAYSARRKSLGQQRRQIGLGAQGHGVTRRNEVITKLEDAEARWVRSKCQEIAAHVCKLAERKGVGRLLVENWSNPAKDGAPELGEHVEYLVRSFPLGQLRTTIEWAAKRRGLIVEKVSTTHNSHDCPSCGHNNSTPAQAGVFRCEHCQLERPTDVIFAWNMLRRFGVTPGIEEAKQATKRARGKMRGGKGKTK